MTNAEKFLKDGVDIDVLSKQIATYLIPYYKLSDTTKVYEDLVGFFRKTIKPILTEDEKVIMKYVNQEKYARIGRTKNGEIIFRNVNDSYCVLTPYFNFETLFQFIQPRRRI